MSNSPIPTLIFKNSSNLGASTVNFVSPFFRQLITQSSYVNPNFEKLVRSPGLSNVATNENGTVNTFDSTGKMIQQPLNENSVGDAIEFGNVQARENAISTAETALSTEAEGAGIAAGNLLGDVVSDPILNIAGQAVGVGLSHIDDAKLSAANLQLSNTFNSDQRVIQQRSINSIQDQSNSMQLGATFGSAIPIIGSAIGTGIGYAVNSDTLPGSDLSSPEETAQL